MTVWKILLSIASGMAATFLSGWLGLFFFLAIYIIWWD